LAQGNVVLRLHENLKSISSVVWRTVQGISVECSANVIQYDRKYKQDYDCDEYPLGPSPVAFGNIKRLPVSIGPNPKVDIKEITDCPNYCGNGGNKPDEGKCRLVDD
jgi:hypothetical protein